MTQPAVPGSARSRPDVVADALADEIREGGPDAFGWRRYLYGF